MTGTMPREDSSLLRFGELALLDFAVEILGDGVHAAIEEALLDVAQNHFVAGGQDTWAMPLPMVPAPSTATVLIRSTDKLSPPNWLFTKNARKITKIQNAFASKRRQAGWAEIPYINLRHLRLAAARSRPSLAQVLPGTPTFRTQTSIACCQSECPGLRNSHALHRSLWCERTCFASSTARMRWNSLSLTPPKVRRGHRSFGNDATSGTWQSLHSVKPGRNSARTADRTSVPSLNDVSHDTACERFIVRLDENFRRAPSLIDAAMDEGSFSAISIASSLAIGVGLRPDFSGGVLGIPETEIGIAPESEIALGVFGGGLVWSNAPS